MKNPRIAILVVYFLEDGDSEILDIHLDQIEKNTSHAYKILGVANRLSPFLKEKLLHNPNVEIVDIPTTELRGSKEHSYYLSKLSDYATEGGYSYICTLDCDSFPIAKNWVSTLITRLSEKQPVAAILREENGDTYLTHPSMCFFSCDFASRYRFEFFPREAAIDQDDFRKFLAQQGQKYTDSGIGLSYLLYKEKLDFIKLRRSNVVNDHYLLGGIYDDLIFHLGAMSWNTRDFRMDRNQSKRVQFAVFVRSRVLHSPKGSIRRRLLNLIEMPALEKIRKANASAYKSIRNSLIANPEEYFNYLLDR